MSNYLLFNGSCGTCSQIAKQVEEEVDGILKVRSLAEVEIQTILNSARPDWKWEPMVLEISDDGENIQVYSGVMMRLRLIQLLGISRSWQVASLVHRALQPVYPFQERRRFLKYTGSAVAGLAVIGLNPFKSGQVYAFETPDGVGNARELTGQERKNALDKAAADNNFRTSSCRSDSRSLRAR